METKRVKFFIISSIFIIALSFLTYLTTLNSFFTGPDFSMVYGGEYGKISGVLGILLEPSGKDIAIRPLTEATWFLDYRLWGLNPTGYRIVNLMMHSINSILVLFLSFFLLRDKLVALGAGVLFAIHPIHSGVVSFISQRYDLMCTLFYLFSLVTFALYAYAQRSGLFYIISIISYPLALFSKEMAITLPLVIILYDTFIIKRFSIKSFIDRIKYYIPYITISVIYLVWRVAYTGGVGGCSDPITGKPDFFNFNLLNYIKEAVYYIPRELFIPVNRSLFSSNSIHLVTVVLFLSLIIAIALSLKEILKNIHLIIFGFFWMVITLIPVHNLMTESNILADSRFLYLPSAGFCIALAFMFLGDKTGYIKRYLSLSIFTLFCIIYIFVTNKNNSVWISAGEINRSIPRVVNEYYKRYGADIKCFFLMPNRTGGGADLFAEELPLVLAPLFAPLGPESVVLLSEDNHGTYCAYISKDFDLRQPDRLHGLGKKVFLFRYNQDKSILEDVSLQIKSGLLKTSAYYKPDWIGDKIKAEVIKYVK